MESHERKAGFSEETPLWFLAYGKRLAHHSLRLFICGWLVATVSCVSLVYMVEGVLPTFFCAFFVFAFLFMENSDVASCCACMFMRCCDWSTFYRWYLCICHLIFVKMTTANTSQRQGMLEKQHKKTFASVSFSSVVLITARIIFADSLLVFYVLLELNSCDCTMFPGYDSVSTRTEDSYGCLLLFIIVRYYLLWPREHMKELLFVLRVTH